MLAAWSVEMTTSTVSGTMMRMMQGLKSSSRVSGNQAVDLRRKSACSSRLIVVRMEIAALSPTK